MLRQHRTDLLLEELDLFGAEGLSLGLRGGDEQCG
jgi:hypothetical protein